ncbi:hypothetical protein Lpp70_00470 [Lacticaseibacillus paracasei subsp. paracasei Lpp70]|nr:hypothetical protein Lpp70_00470 [Lacticaseibacillus paracasei subsp. paracasei Lpp70]
MSNETKRDVVEAILLAKDTDTIWDSSTVRYYLNRYDAALPDDLPVIPKEVSEYIKRMIPIAVGRYIIGDEPLFSIFLTIQHNLNKDYSPDFKAENWIIHHSDTFSRAWVLGVWRVDETGEIVKLEAGHG